MSRKVLTVSVAITAGILSMLGAILGNIATSTIPPSILPSLRFSWPALGVVSFLSVSISVLQAIKNEKTSFSSAQSMTNSSVSSSASVESIICPYCHQNDLQVQGKSKDSLILECKNCGKFLRVMYKGNQLLKMIIPGAAVLIGTIEIANYFHLDSDSISDIFWDLFDSF